MCITRGRVVAGIVSIATVAAAVATLSQCWFQRSNPEDEAAKHVAEIARLVALDDPDKTSTAIHKYLSVMYRDGLDMTGIPIPDVTLVMAAFEDVDWQGVIMTDVEFACSDRVYDEISAWQKGDQAVAFCARLRRAKFAGAGLKGARFNYADLFRAEFTDAVLTETKFYDSFLSRAVFLGNVKLRGIQVKDSDFSHAEFSPKARFRCTVGNDKCVVVRRSDFSSTSMAGVRFSGAKIDRVDFAGAVLKGARFDCDGYRDGEQSCTILEELCVQGTDLATAKFEGSKISNTDFSDAILIDAEFINVQFDNVVFPKRLEAVARFDHTSRASLNAARRLALDLDDPEEKPCSPNWRRDLTGWLDAFVPAKR